MDDPICLDGELMAAERALIPVTDEGLLRGDGVFEVIRLYDGRPFALAEHLERMRNSATNLRLALDLAQVRADVQRLIEAATPGDAALRVLVTRGGRRIAMLEALPELPDTLALVSVTCAPTRVLDGIKSLSYAANMLCSRLAREQGGSEALMVTPHGRVLEAPTASFFWARDGELLTPPLEDHLLDSITRRAVMSVAAVRETPTTLDDLRGAREAFLASSLKEVCPVHAIDDIALAAPGPLTLRTAEAVAAHIARRVGDDST